MLPGAWRIAGPSERAFQQYGDHAYFASPHGELILSRHKPDGLERVLLTWKMRGGRLVIDQPSNPREDIVDVVVASAHTLQIDGSWYVRDDAFDPEAPRFALVVAGAWYGIENAGPEPFTPFLMIEASGKRQLLRVVTNTADEAELAADRLVREHRPFERAVWVRDGRLRLDAGELVASDAIVVDVFASDGSRSHQHGLPYVLGPAGAQIGGGLHAI